MKSATIKISISIIAILFIFFGVQNNIGVMDNEKADEVWPKVKPQEVIEVNN